MLLNHLQKISSARILISRHLQTSNFICSAQQSPLFKLRQKTGLAYNLCREALNKHDNDVHKAESWLEAQALVHGLQKATKVRGRSAREGLVGLAMHQSSKVATILELNCETDFVARNQIFKDFTLDLTVQVASLLSNCIVSELPNQNLIEQLQPTEEQLRTIDEQIVPLITKLGENIKLKKVVHFKSVSDDTLLFGQIHAQSGQKRVNDLDVMTGRFGATVALQSNIHKSTSDNPLLNIGHRLCRHVIGYSPTYIELPDSIKQQLESLEAAEKEKSILRRAGDEEEEGSDSEENLSVHSSRDDWPSIMDQVLIMSDDTTVRDFCKKNEVSIVFFNRFECGAEA